MTYLLKKILLNKMRLLTILFSLFLINNYLFAQTATYSAVGSGSWVCPAGVTAVTVECWGSGGGGGNSANGTINGGSGGGGGAYSRSTKTVTPGSTYYYSVGTIGTGAPAGVGNATSGGDSWFNSTGVNATPGSATEGVLAKGGGLGGNDGGASGIGGQSASGYGTTVFSGGSGGVGGGGAKTGGAGGGSSAGTGADGANAADGNGTAGATAPAGGGNGGSGSTTTVGLPGVAPGGGGGGSDDDAADKGGDGAAGKVVITWPTLTIGNNAVAPASVCPNKFDVPIHSFSLTGTSGGGTVTGLTFVTTGTYTAAEIYNFKLYYTTTSSFATTNLLATITSPATAGTQTFPSFSKPIGTETIWFWITMDLYDATNGNTIAVNGTLISNITETGAELLGGPSTAGGTQTFTTTAVGDAGIITGTSYVCLNQTGVAYSCAAISGAASYNWIMTPDASIATGSGTNSITVDFGASAESGYIYVKGNDGVCEGRWSRIIIGVMDAPVILTDPVSTYGCNGTSLTFSVEALGAGLTYQWQENTVDLSDGGVYSGVNTATLTISDPSGLNGRQYRCIVTGQCSPSATSASATLNVLGSGMSGTYTVGTAGNYARLELAFTAINTNGLIGNVNLEIISDITETATASLNQWNSCGNSGYTVTIYPKTATRTISGNIATSLITLNGADNVTFNGKIDGTGAANSLILSNLNTSGSTIKFINDATYNTIKYCTLKGVSTASTTGVVWFSTANTTGNDYNTISYCDIRDGATTPTICIYSLGTTAKVNDNNTISNCNIFNHHNVSAGGSTNGIYLENYNSKWTFSGNSFYQTSNRTMNSYRALLIAGSSGDEYVITNNYIGGQAPACGGAAMNYTNSGWVTLWYGMQIDVSNTGKSTMSGNIVKNISCTLVPSSTGSIRWAGFATLGRVDMINNTIGDNSTGSIAIIYNDNGTESGGHVGVYKLGNGDILNNTVGSISLSGTCGDLSTFYGMLVTGSLTTDMLIDGNVIGNLTTGNSIQIASGATPLLDCYGIIFGTSGSFTTTVSNNKVANISNGCTGSTHSTFGISNSATAGKQRVIGNQIFNISTAGTSILTNTWPVLAGIKNNNTTTGNFTITNNIIHSLSATGSTAINVHGILLNNATTGTNVVSKNFIHSFYTTSTSSEQNGIFLYSGTATLSNNMIRLGIDKDGNSITTSALIRGILKSTTSNTNIYYNSIYIGGTGVASGTVNTYAISRTATATDNIINNILFNARSNSSGTGKHYAIFINATTTLTANYNNLYVTGTGGCISNAGGGCTFANWQALGFDASGQTLDPSLNNATGNASAVNLHLLNDASPMIDKGYYLASVLTDYDGQQRKIGPTPPNNNGDDPCIGADERIIPPSAQNTYGIYIADAQNGTISDCEIYSTGGTPGGTGYSIFANGSSTNYSNVDISSYQVITQDNIQCTNTDIDFTTESGSPDWLLGNGSSPSSGSTTPITTQYSSTGRKDIIENIKVFKDFTNLTMTTPSSGSILGAPVGAGCPTTYNYVSSVAGSAGFTYSWSSSVPGGCSTSIADPTSESTDITFVNTTGYNQVFTLYLDITSECCGPLTQVVRHITIWPAPLAPSVTDAAPSVCTGGSQVISVSSPDASYAYEWYDAASGGSLLGSGTSYTVDPALTGANSYFVEATNSFGCVSERTEVVVTGNDTPTPTVPDNSTCGANDVTLAVTAPGASYTYNWYSNNCSGLLQTGTSTVFTTNITTTTTIYVSAQPPGCGASLCTPVTITYTVPPNPIVWQGDVSNDWFNPQNWSSDCLPTCGANVQIPNVGLNPQIGFNAAGGAECQNVELQSGANLEFTDSRAELFVCGNFTHDGILTTNNLGEVIFYGSTAAQTYSKTGTGDFHNVKISNTFSTPTVTLSNADMVLDASGTLTLSSGRLVTGSYYAIVKNTATSSVAGHSTSSYVHGNLRRYIAASGSYDFPVGNATSYQLANLNISSITGLTYITTSFANPGTATGTGLPITETCYNSNAILNNGSPGGNGGVWTVTPDAGSATYSLTLNGRNYDNAGLCHTLVSRTNSGVAWGFEGSTHVSQSISGGVVTATRSGFTGFSDKAIVLSPTVLPIQLIYFTSYCNKYNELNWATATEVNNNYFVLEKSYDGNNFSFVAKINASGNSNDVRKYSYTDYSSNFSLVYYRLKQVDYNGDYTYSDVISTYCKTANELLDIFKANSDDLSFLIKNAVPEKNYMLIIYDQVGKCLVTKNIQLQSSEQTVSFDENLSSGIYNVVVRSEDDFICKQFVIYNK